MRNQLTRFTGSFALGAAALLLGAQTVLANENKAPEPPAPTADRGLAIKARKALTVPLEGQQFIDNAVLLVKDGKIEAIGPAATTPIPLGYEVMDVGDQWLMPGMIDLHSHIAGTFDINDTVYLTNPGLRAHASVIPENPSLQRAVAGGVTTILFIPGSGSNMGGWGVLLKTGHDKYEEMQIRNPGSLKLAQAGNPESFLFGVGRSFMNWNTRNTFERGVAYAKRWEAFDQGQGPKPDRDLQFDIMNSLYKHETQVSTHTQIYQVVNATLTTVAEELKLPVYIDHGTFDGHRAAPRAMELGVSAILGPRSVDIPTAGFVRWSGSNPEKIGGVAAGYQEHGMEMIGFNTDAPVIPEEELSLQAAMGVRYGFKYDQLQTVRGLTIIPAVTAGIDGRVGSLEVGKDADVLIVTGDPADPRTSIEGVLIDGEKVYDPHENRRRW
ncbi:MAG: amidohydrolase family protein [Planctomycetes bacterium]|nr:amidohydrolase family protein [Planctomycetota bacterium]MCB9902782.1 amidohydrolase family protein [Planctomycetota bacterium]